MRSSRLSTSAALRPAAGSSTMQEARPGRERAREFEHALLAVGERACERDAPRRPARRRPAAPCASARQRAWSRRNGGAVDEILPGRDGVMDVKARDDVVEHRKLPEQPDLLERARDAEPHAAVRRQCRPRSVPPKIKRAGIRLIDPADQVEQRRLAGAVRPDDGEDRAGRDRRTKRREPRARRRSSCAGFGR